MRSIIALLVALTAVNASFNTLDVYQTVPRNYGLVHKTYYRWLYPSFYKDYYQGYMPQNIQQSGPYYLTHQELYERPLMIITPSADAPHSFSAFSVHHGLQSVFRYQSLKWLHEYMKTPGLKGIIFHPRHMYNVRFLDTPITSLTLSEDFRAEDLMNMMTDSESIPVLFMAPEQVFDQMHFENIAKFSEFKVYKDLIEMIPVTSHQYPQEVSSMYYHEAQNVANFVQPQAETQSHHPDASMPQLSQPTHISKTDLIAENVEKDFIPKVELDVRVVQPEVAVTPVARAVVQESPEDVTSVESVSKSTSTVVGNVVAKGIIAPHLTDVSNLQDAFPEDATLKESYSVSRSKMNPVLPSLEVLDPTVGST